MNIKFLLCKHKYIPTFRIGGDTQLYGSVCNKCGKKKLKNYGNTTEANYDNAYRRYLFLKEKN